MGTIDYVLADPAGNKTILVITEVQREDYQKVTGALLEHCPEAEQVGFIKSKGRDGFEGIPYMEMCGLEFCGNASRSFAYYEASLQEPVPEEMTICVSGSDRPLKVMVDVKGNRSKIDMPLPIGMKRIEIPVKTDSSEETPSIISGNLVEMEGIAHLVVNDVAAEEDVFVQIRDWVYGHEKDYPAFGVMFFDAAESRLSPVVYVRDVDTIYFEGSCASGTVAAAYAMNATCCVPVRTHVFREPAGTLEVEVHIEKGHISRMLLDGEITVSEVKQFRLKNH